MSLIDRSVARLLPLVPKPIVRKVADPYIAGETVDDLLRVGGELNREGYLVAAAILGEFVSSRSEAEGVVAEYQGLLDRMKAAGLNAYIHVKPTHLGLKIDRDFCMANVRQVLDTARKNGQFVRMDMEDSPCIEDTLWIFHRLHEQYDNVGIVIQARMRRSLEDTRKLARVKANVRVCKGIYIEPYAIAHTNPEVVNRAFMALVEELVKAGAYTAIATHDEKLVWDSYRMLEQHGVAKDRYEFQMLLGVLGPLRRIIHDDGHPLRVAVPFGPNWYPYSLRRLRKNPAIAGYVMKSMFKG